MQCVDVETREVVQGSQCPIWKTNSALGRGRRENVLNTTLSVGQLNLPETQQNKRDSKPMGPLMFLGNMKSMALPYGDAGKEHNRLAKKGHIHRALRMMTGEETPFLHERMVAKHKHFSLVIILQIFSGLGRPEPT